MPIHLSLITPDGILFDAEVDAVTLPTADGEITVLPHHIPLLSILLPGTVVAHKGQQDLAFAVSRGVVEVDGLSIKLLADTADKAEELEEAAIEKAKQRAEQLMAEKRTDAEGFAEAQALLERELARLKTVRRHRTHMRSAPPSQS